jgi:hypothetical protein
MTDRKPFLYRLWGQGQQHLACGRYSAARRALEAAEAIAWRQRDAASLARIYLPLLETRRLLRYQAVEGQIVVCEPLGGAATAQRQQLRHFLIQAAGTILLPVARDPVQALHAAQSIRFAACRTNRPLEALVLLQQRATTRVASPADARWSAGLPVISTRDERAAIGESTDPNLKVLLPSPGQYDGKNRGLGALARESLIIAWEALTLRWQSRHPLVRRATPWDEMAWLRRALKVDPACEPVMMRLIALAEGLQLRGNC